MGQQFLGSTKPTDVIISFPISIEDMPPVDSGTVTSIDITGPSSIFIWSGGPVTTAGTLTASLATQTAKYVWAGPTSGSAAAPTFRALAAADIPALAYVTSVGLSLPGELSVSGSPVTSSGTLAATWASQTQNKVLASPNGSTGTPSFRALVAADVPALSYASNALTSAHILVGNGSNVAADVAMSGDATITNAGVITVAKVNGVAYGASPGTNTVPVVTGSNTITYEAVPNAALANSAITINGTSVSLGGSITVSGGSVSSVGISGPSIIAWSNTPVTSSGTLTGVLANQNANIVLAGPSSGGAAAPTFRALVAADLPTIVSLGTVTTGVWNATVITPTYGGTGLATLTAHAVMLGEGTSNVAFATIGTAGRLLIDQGAAADPSFNAMSGDATITNAGVITVAKVNGVAYGASPGTNTVPVVTGSNTITYEAVPNAALANSAITINGTSVSLGGSITVSGQTTAYITSTVSTTSSTFGNVTGLSFAIGANEAWTAEFYLIIASPSAGGSSYGFTGPTGGTFANTILVGTGGATTSLASQANQSTFPIHSTAVFNTQSVVISWVKITLCVLNGSTAGTVQLQQASAVNGQQNDVRAGSYMVARKM